MPNPSATVVGYSFWLSRLGICSPPTPSFLAGTTVVPNLGATSSLNRPHLDTASSLIRLQPDPTAVVHPWLWCDLSSLSLARSTVEPGLVVSLILDSLPRLTPT
jgi:hypothetical protein